MYLYVSCLLHSKEATVLNKASLAFKNKIVAAFGVDNGTEIELELKLPGAKRRRGKTPGTSKNLFI